jgi:hypothetical protein
MTGWGPIVDFCDTKNRFLLFHKDVCVAVCLTDYELFQKISVLRRKIFISQWRNPVFFVCLFVREGGLLRSYFPIRNLVHLVGHRTSTKRLLGWSLVFHYADMGKTTGHSGRNISK